MNRKKTPASADIEPPSEAFERAWKCYPHRGKGESNPKQLAWVEWRKRVAAGVSEDVLEAATKSYAEAMEETGKVGTPFVLQAKTFYGPSRRWVEYMPGADDGRSTTPAADPVRPGPGAGSAGGTVRGGFTLPPGYDPEAEDFASKLT